MAIITKVEVQKNNKQKVNLYLDNEYYNRVYLDTCVKYGLKVGLDVDESKLEEIILESEINIAFNMAINYVGSALKTRKQITDYLKKKEFADCVTKAVVDKLVDYKYIDDEQYVASYVNFYSGKYGITKLKNNLKAKGVSDKIIQNYFEDNAEDLNEKMEDLCTVLARKKAQNLDMQDYKNIQKISRFLLSRGFDFDEINHSIEIIKKEK